eukprot:gene2975-5835_t
MENAAKSTPEVMSNNKVNESIDTRKTNPSKRKRPAVARDISNIEIEGLIGSGTYGDVSIGVDKNTKQKLAIKRVKMENEHHGFPITALREIKILKALRHENIISLVEVLTSLPNDGSEDVNKGGIFLAFEYANYDLSALINSPRYRLTPAHVRSYTKQLLEGLYYMHKNKIIHRDLKPANLLITKDNRLKIADFGLSRTYSEDATNRFTEVVATLWYRPPELFFGERNYGPEIDIWAVGCILPEMVLGSAIFGGNPATDAAQIERIFRVCGTPHGPVLAKFARLPHWDKRKLKAPAAAASAAASGETDLVLPCRMKERFKAITDSNCLNLVEQLLSMDRSTRITALHSLDHNYFWIPDQTPTPDSLPRFIGDDLHESDLRKSMVAHAGRGGGGRGGAPDGTQGGGRGGGRGTYRGGGTNRFVPVGKVDGRGTKPVPGAAHTHGHGHGGHGHGHGHPPGRGGGGGVLPAGRGTAAPQSTAIPAAAVVTAAPHPPPSLDAALSSSRGVPPHAKPVNVTGIPGVSLSSSSSSPHPPSATGTTQQLLNQPLHAARSDPPEKRLHKDGHPVGPAVVPDGSSKETSTSK